MPVPLHPDGLDRWVEPLRSARSWDPPPRRTVVVVPHPDDEVLSMGGLIARQRSAGVEVCVVAVTDGDAAYDADGDEDLARTRRAEQNAGLEVLGHEVSDRSVVRLGFPDGGIPEREASLVDSIASHIDRDCLVVATWRKDCHPDHEAVGRAARAATTNVGATLVSSMFWAWHVRSAKALADVGLVELRLSTAERAAKAAAIACHQSQLTSWNGSDPILDQELLVQAPWPSEYFVVDHG